MAGTAIGWHWLRVYIVTKSLHCITLPAMSRQLVKKYALKYNEFLRQHTHNVNIHSHIHTQSCYGNH